MEKEGREMYSESICNSEKEIRSDNSTVGLRSGSNRYSEGIQATVTKKTVQGEGRKEGKCIVKVFVTVKIIRNNNNTVRLRSGINKRGVRLYTEDKTLTVKV